MTTVLDGRKVADKILQKVKEDVEQLKKRDINPKLTVILVGENPASLAYIRQKLKSCKKTGIEDELAEYPESVTTEELIAKINELNEESSVHGMIVQLPLPKHVSEPEVIKAVDPEKDVDGFQAYNVGKMFLSSEFEHLAPCTPKGVIHIMEHYDLPIAGKEAVIIGKSNIVGKPMAIMLLNRGATVTVCHRKTQDVKEHTLRADIVVSAVGKPKLVTADMIKEGAVVIDIGYNLVDGKAVGDVDFEPVSKKASAVTPTPGGTGPTTVACLLENVVTAAQRQNSIE
jgi:methylenetetrahydrofolate dehydrogenase (NADP+) / methenyltetrahydrofolate cyclohydrolase